MLEDIEQLLEKYFPERWSAGDIEIFVGQPRYTSDLAAVNQTINEPVRDFVLRGGKRLRPVLFLTLMKAFGRDPKQYLDFAVMLELIHNGTLVIDDIEDNSALRRGKPTLHNAFGIDVAVNTGVAMHVLPLRILANSNAITEQQKLQAFQIYSEEISNLYFGQATDIYWHKNLIRDVTLDEYLEMCRLKTGSLMRMAVRLACALTIQEKNIEQSLMLFAESAGIAFQIKDDVLDLTANEETFGKAFGNDITEGKISLPVIFALQELDEERRDKLFQILQAHTREKDEIKEALGLISQTAAINHSLEQAERLMVLAHQELEKAITTPEGRSLLQKLTDSFIKRNK